ncbi:MAG: glycerol-3-phosphate 1-O-acyltransferase PlsY [Syntrophomonadaceae bacterium]|jgi:glycerol-3-phosphate acyltransferase PlsY|nr:glycerol-3-phosphate 1-O-acyltransferase PlsY [Syntrophomonadaceae bacterium]
MWSAVMVILAYLLGSIPFSFVVSRWLGRVDIRFQGSGNIGATNVLRSAGLGYALLAVVGDIVKGMLAAWLGLLVGGVVLGAWCAAAAVIGHCWPVYLQFRGGKGVATSAGVLLVLTPRVFLALLVIFVATVAIFRIVSVGSLVAAIVNPVVIAVIYQSWPLIVMGAILSLIVIYRHHSNINRLRRGIEPRLGEKR